VGRAPDTSTREPPNFCEIPIKELDGKDASSGYILSRDYALVALNVFTRSIIRTGNAKDPRIAGIM
jgi:hypothetical protein